MGASECSRPQEPAPKKAAFRPVKIYKLASLAACIAVMAAALPAWVAGGPEVGEIPDGTDSPQMVRMVPEPEEDKSGKEAAPVNEPAMANEPVLSNEPVVAEPKPVTENPEQMDEPETQGEEPEDEDFGQEDGAVDAPVISVGKLLPAMAAANTSLGDMEVRIVEAADGSCTLEVTTADHKTAEVTLSQDEEDGHWEVQEADEDV